jgi:hypothetical protein|tara:strand:- start:1215 stop:1553 length:339 start_codon:yes stop_codon:yes gene_type:complete
MEGTIKSSKPTLADVQSKSPTASVLSVNKEGVLTERGGPIYMTQPIVTDISTDDDRGACCEGETLITEVNKVTEDIFLPVLFTDSYGNLIPVIQSLVNIGNNVGVPLARNNL